MPLRPRGEIQNYGISQGDYFAPTQASRWYGDIKADAAERNASRPSGGGGGGGSVYTPQGYQYKSMQDLFVNPELDFQKQQWATENSQKEAWKNRIFGMLGNFNPGGSSYSVGGQSGDRPEIGVNPIFSQDQIKQNINAARASNDQTMASQQRNFTQEATGRGFAAGSPLVAAMNAQLGGANMAANADVTRQMSSEAAGQNAAHVLKAQGARSEDFARAMDEDIRRRQVAQSANNTWLQVLAGFA